MSQWLITQVLNVPAIHISVWWHFIIAQLINGTFTKFLSSSSCTEIQMLLLILPWLYSLPSDSRLGSNRPVIPYETFLFLEPIFPEDNALGSTETLRMPHHNMGKMSGFKRNKLTYATPKTGVVIINTNHKSLWTKPYFSIKAVSYTKMDLMPSPDLQSS